MGTKTAVSFANIFKEYSETQTLSKQNSPDGHVISFQI